MRKILLVFNLALTVSTAAADPAPALSSAEIHAALRKLDVLGAVLYVAAHPDDENTRLLAYLAKEKLYRTGYLSLNRGEGGQNLIGPEQGALLGLIRTQELLKARAVDGAEQFFTRAVDFGYSKTTEETLAKWGRDSILADVVWLLRTFRPSVIITRFSPTVGGHGHHTASAELALEAFAAAADSTRFPEQLKLTTPWKVHRVYWNAWRLEEKPGAPPLPSVDVGTWNPLLGQGYNEIAALSRNNHKSQGFGTKPLRGSEIDRFQLMAGDSAAALFDKVDEGWAQVKGGAAVSALVKQAVRSFDFTDPGKSLPQVLGIHARLATLPDGYWVNVKKAETEALIRALIGLWVEATVETPTAAVGSRVPLKVKVVTRAQPGWTLEKVAYPFQGDTTVNLELRKNVAESLQTVLTLPSLASAAEELSLKVSLTFRGKGQKDQSFTWTAPVEYAYLDKVRGEIFQPFVVTPEATVRIDHQVGLFPGNEAKSLSVTVKNHRADSVGGTARLRLPAGWKSEPASRSFLVRGRNAEERLAFRVHPPAGAYQGMVGAELVVDGKALDQGMDQVEYPHIPTQTVFPKAEAPLVKADIRAGKEKVGYIMGAGDLIPEELRAMGYAVTVLGEGALDGDLGRFDVLVAGVRAYNTRRDLALRRGKLMDFVHKGGRLIVQYTVNSGLVTEDLGPYPLKLSRDRITLEEAPLKILDANHPFFLVPNKIGPADFEGWVQERGLYFAGPFDAKYVPLLEGSDPGEKPGRGILIVARHGKGSFVYTGLALFRQLPAGVPGGYRLFANLISAPLEKTGK